MGSGGGSVCSPARQNPTGTSTRPWENGMKSPRAFSMLSADPSHKGSASLTRISPWRLTCTGSHLRLCNGGLMGCTGTQAGGALSARDRHPPPSWWAAPVSGHQGSFCMVQRGQIPPGSQSGSLVTHSQAHAWTRMPPLFLPLGPFVLENLDPLFFQACGLPFPE